jgi:tetratricopeptide (TPR) repeat protein
MAAEFGAKTRLETWKEVAAFFRKDVRTVKRWEAERGLPIHRFPGAGRSRIFAVVAELEAWRDGANLDAGAPRGPQVEKEDAPTSADVVRPAKALPWVRSLLVVGMTVATVVAILAVADAKLIGARARPPPLEAQRAFLAASDDWAKRTPESLGRALAEYNTAIALDPDYAEAYAGLASTYDILREYTHMPPAQAYPLARAAARRALALDDRVASAHTALAFAEYWGFWNEAAARREFERAIALDPRSPTAQHWYATFLSGIGDQRDALAHINAAQALDPASTSVAADRGVILVVAGHPGEGLAALAADGGPRAFLHALTERQLERFRNGQVSAFSVARLYALMGDQARALAFLRLSLERRESDLMDVRANEAFKTLRTRPEFAAIVAGATPLDAG